MLTLVVEDDSLSAFALAEQVELAGHSVVGPARSSGEALMLVRAQRPKVALIDLDLETQGAGVHLAQKLSKEFDMPLIFVTGQVELARAHATHALGLLSKPFEAGDVAEVLTYLRTSLAGEHPSPPRTRAFEPFP